jgi:hypothetical protein
MSIAQGAFMKADDFDDRFLKLALLMAEKGYVVVAYESNGTDISLRLRASEKIGEKSQTGT